MRRPRGFPYRHVIEEACRHWNCVRIATASETLLVCNPDFCACLHCSFIFLTSVTNLLVWRLPISVNKSLVGLFHFNWVFKMAADVQTIAPILQATLNPRENKQGGSSPILITVALHALSLTVVVTISSESKLTHISAEIALLRAEKSPGFSITLLEIVAAGQQLYTTRLASALCFKNFVKRHWTVGIYSTG